MKSLFIISIIFIVFIGCKQNEMIEYENDPRLYFYRGTYNFENVYYVQNDSLFQSFFVLNQNQKRDTTYILVYSMGLPVDYDRPISIEQTNKGAEFAAIPGTHYVDFKDESLKNQMVIPANEVSKRIPIILIKDESLELASYRIEMKIVDNEYFKVGINDNDKFLLTTTAMADKPALWDSYWVYYFGVWGSVKMAFIRDYIGWTNFDERTDMGTSTYLKFKANQELEKYNKANPDNPLREANNDLVEFP